MPTARLVSGLEDVQVYNGEDAVFSLDLSTIIQGTWFLNGEELKSNEPEGQMGPGALRYRMEQKGLQHRLILQAVKHQDSGALVGFSCPGVQDSAALTIQGWWWQGPAGGHIGRVKIQKYYWQNEADSVPISHTWAGRVRSIIVGSGRGLGGPERFQPICNVQGTPCYAHQHHIQIFWSILWFIESYHVCHLRDMDPGP